MIREEKIDFIVRNFPEFDKDTPQEWRNRLRSELNKKSNKELQKEFEWVNYLLDK